MQRCKDTSAGPHGLVESLPSVGFQERLGSLSACSDESSVASGRLDVPGAFGPVGDLAPMGGPVEDSAAGPHLPDRPGVEAETWTPFLVDEVKSGAADRVRTYGDRVRRAHERGRELQKRPEPEARKVGEALESCGSVLWFRRYTSLGDQPERLSRMFACQVPLLCPFCAARLSAVHLCRAVSKVLTVLAERPDLAVYLGTFTIPTGPDVRTQANRFWKCWSKSIEGRQSWLKFVSNPTRRRQRWTPFAEFEGGIIRGEVKRSKSDASHWHYHAHGVFLGRPGLVQAGHVESNQIFYRVSGDGRRTYACGSMADEWSRCVGIPYADCDLQELKSSVARRDGFKLEDLKESIGDELQEVFRYVVKVNDLSEDDLWACYLGLRRRPRLMQQRAFGCLRSVDLNPGFTDDLSEFEGLPFEELVYRYLESEGAYKLCSQAEALPRWSEFDAFAS